MSADTKKKPAILNLAWTHAAQFSAASKRKKNPYYDLRKWVLIFGVLATLFAVLTQLFSETLPAIVSLILKILLIAAPLAGSALAAFTAKFFGGGDWLILRAGAEEIKMEIYKFRTIYRNEPKRRENLEKKLVDIQRQVFKGLGGELVLQDFPQDIGPGNEPGFNDMTGDEYFQYRLEDQLSWHLGKVNEKQTQRIRLQIYILLAGVGGAFLAAFGGTLSIWVALTASIASSLIGWQELQNLDTVVRNYSKVIMELNIIYGHWNSLDPAERTEAEFKDMVEDTESILWSQNSEYIKAMQEAGAKSTITKGGEEMMEDLLDKAQETDASFQKSMRDAMVEHTAATMDETRGKLEDTFEETLGTLAEEANSELVRKELEAMQAAAASAVAAVAAGAFRLTDRLGAIAKEFEGVHIGKETPNTVLNDMISRFPTTGEPKG
jgi:hypothetical protein